MADDLYHIESGSSLYAGIPQGLGNIGNRRIAIWGQSNALGRAEQSDLSLPPLDADPELQAYMSGAKPFSRVFIQVGANFVPLTNANTGTIAGQFGPEFGLAVRWTRDTTGGNLYIEKKAFSGQSITYFDPTGLPFSSWITEHNRGTTWLQTNGITVTGKDWLWVQGETDMNQSTQWYQDRLTALIDARTANGMTTPQTMMVFALMKVGSSQWSANNDAAKQAVAAVDPAHRKLIRMDHYKADKLHSDGRGQLKLSYDTFSELFGTPKVGV